MMNPAPNMNNPTVLVVEDEESFVEALKVGFAALPAAQVGLDALRQAQARETLAPPSNEEPVPPAYEPPVMTDEKAAAVARDVARIMALGEQAVFRDSTSTLQTMQFAVRAALWEHGFLDDKHYGRETFRRRLYRAGIMNRNDPALLAFESERERLSKQARKKTQ